MKTQNLINLFFYAIVAIAVSAIILGAFHIAAGHFHSMAGL